MSGVNFNEWVDARIVAIDEIIEQRLANEEHFSKASFQYLNDVKDGLLAMSSQIKENVENT